MVTASDVKEICKSFTPENCSITRIAGAYVTSGKSIVMSFKEMFLNLEEKEFHKYLKIITKVWNSKEIENKLLTLEFEQHEQKTALDMLLRTQLKDDHLIDAFYQKITDVYETTDNYLILLLHNVYDVVKIAKDGSSLEESDEVYEYIQCMICPVNLSKPGLQYSPEENRICAIDRDWVVDDPRVSFVYPTFEERTTEEHVMYYIKKPQCRAPEIIEKILGCRDKRPESVAKEMFEEIFGEVLQEEALIDKELMNVNKTFEGMMTEESMNMSITDEDIKGILEVSGMQKNYAEKIIDKYERIFMDEWPRFRWLYDGKYATAAVAEETKKKGKELLIRASRALSHVGTMDLAQEIDEYIESRRW